MFKWKTKEGEEIPLNEMSEQRLKDSYKSILERSEKAHNTAQKIRSDIEDLDEKEKEALKEYQRISSELKRMKKLENKVSELECELYQRGLKRRTKIKEI